MPWVYDIRIGKGPREGNLLKSFFLRLRMETGAKWILLPLFFLPLIYFSTTTHCHPLQGLGYDHTQEVLALTAPWDVKGLNRKIKKREQKTMGLPSVPNESGAELRASREARPQACKVSFDLGPREERGPRFLSTYSVPPGVLDICLIYPIQEPQGARSYCL